MSKPQTPEAPTYVERTCKVNQEVISKCIDDGLKKIELARDAAKDGANQLIKSCNYLRAAGKDFTDAEAQGQAAFKFYFETIKQDGWKRAAELKIIVDGSKKIFRLMPKPAETFEDCRPAIQIAMQLCEQMPKQRRTHKQVAHIPNIWNEMMGDLSSLESLQRKFTEENPMESWTFERLDAFVNEVEPICKRYETAKELLEKMA